MRPIRGGEFPSRPEQIPGLAVLQVPEGRGPPFWRCGKRAFLRMMVVYRDVL